jgi:hypothetical protein
MEYFFFAFWGPIIWRNFEVWILMKSSMYTLTKGDQMGQISFHLSKSSFGFYSKFKP